MEFGELPPPLRAGWRRLLRALRGRAGGQRVLSPALFFSRPSSPGGNERWRQPLSAGPGGRAGAARPKALARRCGLPGGCSLPAPEGRPGRCRQIGLRKGGMREGLQQPWGERPAFPAVPLGTSGDRESGPLVAGKHGSTFRWHRGPVLICLQSGDPSVNGSACSFMLEVRERSP